MGSTWAAFYGSDADAVVAGDMAMRDSEVTRVLNALRANGIDGVAIHHHMTTTPATVYFLTTGDMGRHRSWRRAFAQPSMNWGKGASHTD